MIAINANTADAAWKKALAFVRNPQAAGIQDGRGGKTFELLHAGFSIRDPRQRWTVTRWPPINPAFALAEVIWILQGRNDAVFPNYWNSQLPRFAGSGDTYHGAYGYRLRKHFGLDQLDRAYHALTSNPDSRQVVLQLWDPASDFPNDQGAPAAEDIPCNVSAMLKLRGGRLEWTQVMRSNDLFRGTPYNVIQFTTLQEILAGWLGAKVGTYTHIADSLHLYLEDAGSLQVDESVSAKVNPDSLCLSREKFDSFFPTLASHAERLTKQGLVQSELEDMMNSSQIPPSYKDILLLLAAEAARRRRWTEDESAIQEKIANPALLQVSRRWSAAVGKRNSQ